MEDVLGVYELPYDPDFPVVCMDEASKQLIGEVHAPQSADVNRYRREDYEYTRHGPMGPAISSCSWSRCGVGAM